MPADIFCSTVVLAMRAFPAGSICKVIGERLPSSTLPESSVLTATIDDDVPRGVSGDTYWAVPVAHDEVPDDVVIRDIAHRDTFPTSVGFILHSWIPGITMIPRSVWRSDIDIVPMGLKMHVHEGF